MRYETMKTTELLSCADLAARAFGDGMFFPCHSFIPIVLYLKTQCRRDRHSAAVWHVR